MAANFARLTELLRREVCSLAYRKGATPVSFNCTKFVCCSITIDLTSQTLYGARESCP